jgi:hypothetical protein
MRNTVVANKILLLKVNQKVLIIHFFNYLKGSCLNKKFASLLSIIVPLFTFGNCMNISKLRNKISWRIRTCHVRV